MSANTPSGRGTPSTPQTSRSSMENRTPMYAQSPLRNRRPTFDDESPFVVTSLPPTPNTGGNGQNSRKRTYEQITTPERTPSHGTADRYTPLTNRLLDVKEHIGLGENPLPPGYQRDLAAAVVGTDAPVYEGSSAQRQNDLDYSGRSSPTPTTPHGRGRYYSNTSRDGPKKGWTMPKTPYKVLDAPDLVDDFYLNLVDWSSKNILGVGLGSCVYLWNAVSANVTKLCELGENDTISSVSWAPRGQHLAVGTNRGFVQLWDVNQMKRVRQFQTHANRVGTMAWDDFALTSGSRDRQIIHRDSREKAQSIIWRTSQHSQEVCGLNWSPHGKMLASGGNDNKLFIWDQRQITSRESSYPVLTFDRHTAAVKAIAWHPSKHRVLASGGGTADKHIRFWDVTEGKSMGHHNTDSQVCNIAWHKTKDELVSSHGYSNNHVQVWKFDYNAAVNNLKSVEGSYKQVLKENASPLTAHSMRVLYMAMSPDGENIVTGAGDETLRFWRVFEKAGALRSDEDNLRPDTLR